MPELELLVAIFGSLVTILASFGSLAYWLGRRFEAIDKRFEMINKRFEAIDKRFEMVDRRFEALGQELRKTAEGLRNAVISINLMLIEFMGIKGIVTHDEAAFLKAEAQRLAGIVSFSSNPLPSEKMEVLRKILSKDVDDITIEEAEEIANIGKEWWFEDGSEKAYRIFLTGLFIKAYHLPKKYPKRQEPGR